MAQSRGILLVSLPSSGSDWFARQWTSAVGLKYYDKEYFNPLTNWSIIDELTQAFGCEARSTIHNVVLPTFDQLERVVQRTWDQQTNWNCTKEVWSPFSIEHFLRLDFEVGVLTRDTNTTFPPSRARVWNWYDALWHALRDLGHDISGDAKTVFGRAIAAHAFTLEKLKRDAQKYCVPVLSYDELMVAGSPEVIKDRLEPFLKHFSCFAPEQASDLARRLWESRKNSKDCYANRDTSV